jgi:PBSX family phage terminase large subunit
MTLEADLGLSPKQARSVVHADAKVNIWEGAVRSGKTVSSLLRWLTYVAQAPFGGELVVVGRTRDSIYRNVFSPLMDPGLFGPLAAATTYTRGAPTAVMFGRTVHVLGASDAKAEKILRGLTCAGAYVDEATVIPEEFFTQLFARLSVTGAQMFATTNPDNPAHWLKTKWIDRAAELGYRIFRFVLDDNPFLDADYVEGLKRQYTGLWRRRFILGEWVAADGAVYDSFDPARHVVHDLPDDLRWLALGVDYGTTNASAALMLGLSPSQRRLYLTDEWRIQPTDSTTRLTDAEQSQALRAWLPVKPEWVVVDPAAASFKVQLWRDGLTCTDADNDVVYGIRTVSSLLATDALAIHDSCTWLLGEIPGYSWDPKATEKGEDKPVKVADHSLDAARYAIASTQALWANMIPLEGEARAAA